MKVKIAFYHGGGSFIDKAISWWTAPFADKFSRAWQSTPSHCEIGFHDIWYSASTRTGTFRKKSMFLSRDKWRVYDINKLDFEDIDTMQRKAESFIGSMYDWANIIFSDVLQLDKGHNRKLTCDEGCARILQVSKLFADLKKINNMNPRKLEIYIKGKIC